MGRSKGLFDDQIQPIMSGNPALALTATETMGPRSIYLLSTKGAAMGRTQGSTQVKTDCGANGLIAQPEAKGCQRRGCQPSTGLLLLSSQETGFGRGIG